MARRIAAIVLPLLACELVRQRMVQPLAGPLAVILEADAHAVAEGLEIAATAVLDVVDDEARRYGVRPGQKVTEAAALVAGLSIHRVTYAELDAALGRVAEIAMSLGTTAAIRLAEEGKKRAGAKAGAAKRSLEVDSPFDTVWLDVTGVAHLVGEAALVDEIVERVGVLGHRVRVAIADGPRIAQALARWKGAPSPPAIAAPGLGAEALADLPVHALPIERDTASWLVRLGVLTIADLGRLPRAASASRLGARAAEVLALVSGFDPAPLVAYEPPRVLVEEACFEEGVSQVESLLFVLRGMTSRAAARLAARGEACTALEVHIPYDRSIASLRFAERSGGAAPAPEDLILSFAVELPAPLSREGDLLRALKAKLERLELAAPAMGLCLVIPQITEAPRVQLDLSRDVAVSPDALPALLAELSAEIGAERIGVLSIVDAHRPEGRSRLVPPLGALASTSTSTSTPGMPSRLLAEPVALGAVGRALRGAVVAIDQHLYAIEQARFVMRLDGVEWWTAAPASRDYARVYLASGTKSSSSPMGGEAWVYTDRSTGEAFLQGWCE